MLVNQFVYLCVCYSGRRRLLGVGRAGHYCASHLPLSVCTGSFLSSSLSFSSCLFVAGAADPTVC